MVLPLHRLTFRRDGPGCIDCGAVVRDASIWLDDTCPGRSAGMSDTTETDTMGKRFYDCDSLGLNDDQLAALTGFTGRAVRALAHLREAWCGADPQNRAAVQAAIRALLAGHSMADIPAICAAVLTRGLDDGLAVRILEAAGLSHRSEGTR